MNDEPITDADRVRLIASAGPGPGGRLFHGSEIRSYEARLSATEAQRDAARKALKRIAELTDPTRHRCVDTAQALDHLRSIASDALARSDGGEIFSRGGS